MPYKEKEIEKVYYSIGEVAKMFDMNTSHIRFWSKEFDVIKPATNKKGNRMFTLADIENFKKIHHLVKEKGYTLKGAKTELKGERKHKKDYPELSEPVENFVAEPELPLMIEEEKSNTDHTAVLDKLNHVRKSLLELQSQLMGS